MAKGEEQIRKAMEEGQFDDLPGKGKPLKLDENPFEAEEWRLAGKILRDGGFTLPWIERRKEIEAELEAARAALRGARQEDWQAAVGAFRKRISALNKQIRTYNLEVPASRFQMRVVSVEKEIEEIEKG